jgi:hypothetical protein
MSIIIIFSLFNCNFAILREMKMNKYYKYIDRVQVCEWMRKLKALQNSSFAEAKMKNEYMQYLRMSLTGQYCVLTKPFSTPPPEKLIPFGEYIANKTCDAIPEMPRCGKIQPILCHKSDDNRAFMCIERTPENGILCYMAVAPDSIKQ